jgi:hypothetical protein
MELLCKLSMRTNMPRFQIDIARTREIRVLNIYYNKGLGPEILVKFSPEDN